MSGNIGFKRYFCNEDDGSQYPAKLKETVKGKELKHDTGIRGYKMNPVRHFFSNRLGKTVEYKDEEIGTVALGRRSLEAFMVRNKIIESREQFDPKTAEGLLKNFLKTKKSQPAKAPAATTPEKIPPEKALSRIKDVSDFLGKEERLDTEGIFRESAEAKSKDAILLSMRGDAPLDLTRSDAKDVAVAIKIFIEEAGPVIPQEFYAQFRDGEFEIDKINDLIKNLPQDNQQILKAVLDLAAQAESHKEKNRMTFENLAIVFAPRLVPVTDLIDTAKLNKKLEWIMENHEKLNLS